ncbi:hypothetical protein NXS19_008429 [Fusarium pseudograminearum]|nr:hypothetical protein NXS19_008429 [Fusarium pseudograminearum]
MELGRKTLNPRFPQLDCTTNPGVKDHSFSQITQPSPCYCSTVWASNYQTSSFERRSQAFFQGRSLWGPQMSLDRCIWLDGMHLYSMHRPDRRTIEGAGLAQHQQTKRQAEDFSRHTQVQVRFPDGFLFSMRHIAWGENAQDAKRKEDDLKLNVPNKRPNEKSNVVSVA